jgi:hypothetical protein
MGLTLHMSKFREYVLFPFVVLSALCFIREDSLKMEAEKQAKVDASWNDKPEPIAEPVIVEPIPPPPPPPPPPPAPKKPYRRTGFIGTDE